MFYVDVPILVYTSTCYTALHAKTMKYDLNLLSNFSETPTLECIKLNCMALQRLTSRITDT